MRTKLSQYFRHEMPRRLRKAQVAIYAFTAIIALCLLIAPRIYAQGVNDAIDSVDDTASAVWTKYKPMVAVKKHSVWEVLQ